MTIRYANSVLLIPQLKIKVKVNYLVIFKCTWILEERTGAEKSVDTWTEESEKQAQWYE